MAYRAQKRPKSSGGMRETKPDGTGGGMGCPRVSRGIVARMRLWETGSLARATTGNNAPLFFAGPGLARPSP